MLGELLGAQGGEKRGIVRDYLFFRFCLAQLKHVIGLWVAPVLGALLGAQEGAKRGVVREYLFSVFVWLGSSTRLDCGWHSYRENYWELKRVRREESCAITFFPQCLDE